MDQLINLIRNLYHVPSTYCTLYYHKYVLMPSQLILLLLWKELICIFFNVKYSVVKHIYFT